MKKNLLLVFMLGLTMTLQAQEYNLFDAADVDENGWLWLDTKEKIEKYVGMADNENGFTDPNGKILQVIEGAWHPDYIDTITAIGPDIIGVGTDMIQSGVDAKKGGILICSSSKLMEENGGGLAIRMPSCTSLSLYLSCESSKVMLRLFGSTDENIMLDEYKLVSGKYALPFKPLFKGGQFTWNKMETLDSGHEPVFNLTSDKPIVAYFRSRTSYPIYVHGIRVMTSTKPSNVDDLTAISSFAFANNVVTLGKAENIEIYSIAGVQVAAAYGTQMNLNNLAKGIYLVKTDHATHKVAID